MSPRIHLLLSLVALAASGACAPGQGALFVTVSADEPMVRGVDHLTAWVTLDDGTSSNLAVLPLPAGISTIPPSQTLQLRFDKSRSGGASVSVAAEDAHDHFVASGSARVNLTPSQEITASISLTNRFMPGGDGGAGEVLGNQVIGGEAFDYVIDRVTLPTSRTDFATDLNGDGKVDNHFAAFVQYLQSQMSPLQPLQDMDISSGTSVHLLRLITSDIQTDSAVDLSYQAGLPFQSTPTDGGFQGGPDFSGNGRFNLDIKAPRTHFYGKLSAGQFTSNSPIAAQHPVSFVVLDVAVVAGDAPVQLTLNGAHVVASIASNQIMRGELHGSVKSKDINAQLMPAIARSINAQIAKNPNSASSMAILGIYDTGNCTNPDGSTAKAQDKKIDTCEVIENDPNKALFAPDVQIYDAAGNYAPSAANQSPDSLSMGVGFTAVKATLQ